ncbi:MAG: hypothetical protein IJ614_09735 [Prevotella sp.]|nr:hypothetical protein [Prevotella sp.]
MKPRIVLWIIVALLLTGCHRQQPSHTFTNEVLLPMTPVKNQGTTEFCWAYAMLATIETEHLVRGDSVNLSPVYIGRQFPQYRRLLNGKSENVKSTQRAMCQTLLNMLQRYGMVGYDVLPDDATPDLPTPKWVFMLGARYTPLEFAHSVCAPDEYLSLTSVPDSPYYKKVIVPIPDNWERNRLLNLPIDTLRKHIQQALLSRHPVCWESRGHAMAIVGMARDEQQRLYYVMKNSWGPERPHGGLVYMSADKACREAVAVYMTRDAYGDKLPLTYSTSK